MGKVREGEQLVTRMQPYEIAALDEEAARIGVPRARLVRDVLRDFLRGRGLTGDKR